MKVIIDRFEDNYAVCEKDDRTIINIERHRLPKAAAEGDVLIINPNNITIDAVETKIRKKQIEELTKDLWK
jgi:hypothetical protein